MQRSGYVLWVTSLIVCFCMMFYNFYWFLQPLYETKVEATLPIPDGELKEENPVVKEEVKEEKKEEEKTPEVTSKSEETSSVQTSAKDVKGQILAKYVSPYSAPQSYNNVYMKNLTGVEVNIKKLLEASLPYTVKSESNDPQVLILHTHATESFMQNDNNYYTSAYSSRSRDNSKNMVRIGEIVTSRLNSGGIKTLHSKTQHDYPEYTGSYNRAAETIRWYLKKYPTIKVVIDLHRDSISDSSKDKTKLVTKIGGKTAAQVMLVMGSNTGSVEGHEKWQENLKLAFKLQQKLEEKYPTLARPLMLASKLYNQNLTTGSILIEMGTDANTQKEAEYSAELVSSALIEVLK